MASLLCCVLAAGLGPLHPTPTAGAFSDTARVAAKFTVHTVPPRSDLLVAFSDTDDRIYAYKHNPAANVGDQGASYDEGSPGQWKWTSESPPGIPMTMLAACGGKFVATNGTNWLQYDAPIWLHLAPASEQDRTGFLIGTDTCVALSGFVWRYYDNQSNSWVAPDRPSGEYPSSPTLGSQSGSEVLVYDANGQYWRGSDGYTTWTKVSGLPEDPDLIAENALIHGKDGWFVLDEDSSKWVPYPILDGSDLGIPIAAGHMDNGDWIVTDGYTWYRTSGQDDLVKIDGPGF